MVFDSISAYLRTKRLRIDMIKAGIAFFHAAVTIAPILYVHYVSTTVWSE